MNKTEELYARRGKTAAGGGRERIKEQHKKGKLTARERLGLLLDPHTFVEMGAFRTHRCTQFGMAEREVPGDGVVTGCGKVNGRLVYVYAQDFTVLGGSLGEIHAEKICRIQEEALRNGAPVVGLLDSGGARIQEGVNALAGFGKIFYRNTMCSGVIPQISAIMGPCAGGAVYSPAITDYILMVDSTSQMFVTGPEVIKTVTGEQVTSQELGGAAIHSEKSGVAHFHTPDDRTCIAKIRELLSFLPDNNKEKVPLKPTADSPHRLNLKLETLLPQSSAKAYDMREIIREIGDDGQFFEIQEAYAPNIIIGYERFHGQTVGVIANQPKVAAGCLDVKASHKAARFIRFCDAFQIPLLTLVDVPGFLPGVSQEYQGIIRHGAKMLYAYSEATVPKITVVVRKAYGGAFIGMCCCSLGADMVLAWPEAQIAVMGAEGAANIIFKQEIQKSEQPDATRNQKILEYTEKFSGPYYSAEQGFVDEVITPRETRLRIIEGFERLKNKKIAAPERKHGNIPL